MSVDACAAMVREADPDRFASAMCAPMPQRADLMVIYAFNVEVARAPWVTEETMIAEMRLQWWKDAVAEIFDEKNVRRHEVVTPLKDVVTRAGLERRLFDELIEARRFDIYREGHSSRAAFDAYIAATSGNVMEMAGRVLGATSSEPFQSFGYALGVSNLIKALPELYMRGRHPIPVNNLDRNACVEGRVSDELAASLSSIANDAWAAARHARKMKIVKNVHPALLAGWYLERPLKAAANAPASILKRDFAASPLHRSARLLWLNLSGRW